MESKKRRHYVYDVCIEYTDAHSMECIDYCKLGTFKTKKAAKEFANTVELDPQTNDSFFEYLCLWKTYRNVSKCIEDVVESIIVGSNHSIVKKG